MPACRPRRRLRLATLALAVLGGGLPVAPGSAQPVTGQGETTVDDSVGQPLVDTDPDAVPIGSAVQGALDPALGGPPAAVPGSGLSVPGSGLGVPADGLDAPLPLPDRAAFD